MRDGQHVILLIDDNDNILEMMAQVFSKKGFLVKKTSDSSQALALFNPEVDLVITDLDMPGLNGLELAHQIQSRSNAPILAVTGLKFYGTKPFSAVLHKPVLPGVMVRTVNNLLEKNKPASSAPPAPSAPSV